MSDRWTDQLSDYLDDDLARADRDALERHLAQCAECRTVLSELDGVRQRAAALVDPSLPDDLWAGIASRIGATGPTTAAEPAPRAERPHVTALPARRRSAPAWMGWLTPQLAAAGVAMFFVGAAVLYAVERWSPSSRTSSVASIGAGSLDARPAAFDAEHIEGEIAQLQAALDHGRDKLDPSTVQVLEKNLSMNRQATEDARRALAADPANRDLERYFVGTMQRKLDLMRRATALAGG